MEEARRDPTPSVSASSSAPPTKLLTKAKITTKKIEIPRVGHDPVVLQLPVVDVGDAKKNALIATWLDPARILGESIDDVRAEAKSVTSPDDVATGVQASSFEVTYDDHALLQIDAATDFMGAYPSSGGFHAVIDLEEPRLLGANDVFRAEAIPSLVARLDARVVAEAKSCAAAKDPDAAGLLTDAHFTTTDLEAFSIGDDGVTFHHDYAFPHAFLALQPDGAYLVDWADLKGDLRADGPLARAAPAKK